MSDVANLFEMKTIASFLHVILFYFYLYFNRLLLFAHVYLTVLVTSYTFNQQTSGYKVTEAYTYEVCIPSWCKESKVMIISLCYYLM